MSEPYRMHFPDGHWIDFDEQGRMTAIGDAGGTMEIKYVNE